MSGIDDEADGTILVPGQRVRVKAGALTGIEGTVVPTESQDGRVMIAVSSSQPGVRLVVPLALIERL